MERGGASLAWMGVTGPTEDETASQRVSAVDPVELYLKAAGAIVVTVFAIAVLIGGPRRPVNVLLASFLGLIAANQAFEIYRAAGADTVALQLRAFRLATVVAALDPFFLYAFVAAFLGWGAQRGFLRKSAPVIGGALALAAWAIQAPLPDRANDNWMWGETVLAFYTATVYTVLWVGVLRAIRGPSPPPGARLLFPALAFASIPVWMRLSDDILDALDSQFALTIMQDGHYAATTRSLAWAGILVIAGGWAAWTTRRSPAASPELVAFVRRWSLAGVALGLFVNLQVFMAFPGWWGPRWDVRYVKPVNTGGAAIRWLLFSAFVSTGILRHRMLGMSIAQRRTAARLLVAVAFVLVAAGVIATVQAIAGRPAFALTPLEISLLIAALLLSQGFRTLVDRVAAALYGVPRAGAHHPAVEAYASAVRQARAEGKPVEANAALLRLREELGLDEQSARVVQQMAQATDTEPLVAGALVRGRYRIERMLGRGGAGRAFLAQDELLQRAVVLKEVVHDSSGGEAVAMREARIASGLNHPNVVAVHDVLTQPGASIIVTEYVPGGSLADVTLKSGRLKTAEAAPILDGLLAGLEAVHAAGVVHRDLKPSNVLLDGRGIPKIADFGIARIRRGATVQMERDELVSGTLEFMAPEQRIGEVATPRSDVFAVGQLMRHTLDKPVPARVGAIIERALRPDPAERWVSAQEMRRALASAMPQRRASRGT